MADLVERYVYEVVRRLPEKDRDEVRRELNANIYDMLPENPGDEDVRAVLNSLGAPIALAEQYRSNPRYLISPAYYDRYIHTLKWVVPLVGVVLLAIGAISGAVSVISGGMVEIGTFISAILSQGISYGVSGAVQALAWVTVGFVIAERTGAKVWPGTAEWTVDALPDEIPNDKGSIPLSDSIVELIVTVVFTGLAIALFSGAFPFLITIQDGSTQIHQLFSDGFRAACVPVLVIGGIFGICECVAKLVARRWTPPVCAVVIISNLASIGLMLFLFTRPQIFSTQFTAYVQAQEWAQFDLLRFMGSPVGNPVLIIIAVIVIVASLAECGAAIYRTAKAR